MKKSAMPMLLWCAMLGLLSVVSGITVPEAASCTPTRYPAVATNQTPTPTPDVDNGECQHEHCDFTP